MPKPRHDLRLHRPNILVADMERSLRVYRDIIGFEVDFLMDALDVAPEIFGLDPATKMRIAFLSEGRGAFGSLAISEAPDIDLPVREPPYASAIIIELEEGRLTGVLEQLRQAGLVIGQAYELDNPRRTDVSVTDHDGHRVVLFELHTKRC
jgi:catechol 2,3-dioxygenase-like lactoylglutathione lyase family enzyme